VSGLSRGYTPQKRKAKTDARILTFDIETSPMLGYFFQAKTRYITPDKVVDKGGMLSFAAKWYDQKEVLFSSTFHDGYDTMLENLFGLMDQADIVVGYNSERFDVPKIRTAFLLAGFPPMRPFRQVDLLRTVRNQFSFPYNRLDEVAQALGVGKKTTHQGFGLWTACLAGDPKAWALMKKYNVQDVRITEGVYDRIRGYIPNHPNLGLHSEDPRKAVCPNCQSNKLTEAGTARTAQTGYGMLRCDNCGAYSRNNFIKERISRRIVR
jgi:DNA polymerase elongation subunit (family B)